MNESFVKCSRHSGIWGTATVGLCICAPTRYVRESGLFLADTLDVGSIDHSFGAYNRQYDLPRRCYRKVSGWFASSVQCRCCIASKGHLRCSVMSGLPNELRILHKSFATPAILPLRSSGTPRERYAKRETTLTTVCAAGEGNGWDETSSLGPTVARIRYMLAAHPSSKPGMARLS